MARPIVLEGFPEELERRLLAHRRIAAGSMSALSPRESERRLKGINLALEIIAKWDMETIHKVRVVGDAVMYVKGESILIVHRDEPPEPDSE
jgi:hypothetical protein